MFEVKCFVEDKKLDKVMWALDGLVAGMPQVLPVKNAIVRKGEVKAKVAPTGGTLPQKVAEYILKNGASNITWGLLVEGTKAAGGLAGSTGYVVTALKRDGVIGPARKGEHGTTYPVLGKK